MTRRALSAAALAALLICVASVTPGRGQNTLIHKHKQERGLQAAEKESRSKTQISKTQIMSACEGKGGKPADCQRAARRCAGNRDPAQCLEAALERQAVITCTSEGIARAAHCAKLAHACMGKSGGATAACMWREDGRAPLAAACERVGGKPDDCNTIATATADALLIDCQRLGDTYEAADCKLNAASHIAFSIGKALSDAPAQQSDDYNFYDLGHFYDRVGELTKAGKYTEAIDIAKRALAVTESKPNPNDLLLARYRTVLASLYNRQGLYTEAVSLINEVLASVEKALDRDDLLVAQVWGTLAEAYYGQGRNAEAELLLKRSLSIAEKTRDPYYFDIDLNKIAELYRAQGRNAEAELLLKRSLSIAEKSNSVNENSFTKLALGRVLDSLAVLYFSQRDWARATEFWRGGTNAMVGGIRYRKEDVGHALGGDAFVREAVTAADEQHLSLMYRALIKAASQLASHDLNADVRLLREMYQAAQLVAESKAAQSLARMAARSNDYAGGNPYLIREREALVTEWQQREQARSAAAQAPETRDRQAEADNITRTRCDPHAHWRDRQPPQQQRWGTRLSRV